MKHKREGLCLVSHDSIWSKYKQDVQFRRVWETPLKQTSVMYPSHLCRVRVTSPSSQSYPKNFSSRGIVESQELSRSLRVIGLQGRVIVESHEIPYISVFFCYEMVPNMLWNGAW